MSGTKLLPYILIYLLSVFLSSVSQIVLKKEAVREHKNFIREYLNAPVILSYMLFGGCTLLTLIAYRVLPMSYGSVLETAGYITVTVMGSVFLGEHVTKKKLISLAVILTGIIIYAI